MVYLLSEVNVTLPKCNVKVVTREFAQPTKQDEIRNASCNNPLPSSRVIVGNRSLQFRAF